MIACHYIANRILNSKNSVDPQLPFSVVTLVQQRHDKHHRQYGEKTSTCKRRESHPGSRTVRRRATLRSRSTTPTLTPRRLRAARRRCTTCRRRSTTPHRTFPRRRRRRQNPRRRSNRHRTNRAPDRDRRRRHHRRPRCGTGAVPLELGGRRIGPLALRAFGDEAGEVVGAADAGRPLRAGGGAVAMT